MNIAIQGIEGSFHHIASIKLFKEKHTIFPCNTFKAVIDAVKNDVVDVALFAIENSIAGSILSNYLLLQQGGLTIVNEVYLKICQQLLAQPDVTLEDIKEVRSHPIALQQCMQFFQSYKWKLIETEDTALSAKQLSIHKNKHSAAIGSTMAAKIFNLNILLPNIHTLKYNFTRFLVLKKDDNNEDFKESVGRKKASIYFEVEDKKGSLGQVLARFSYRDINLLKLQSSPLPGSKWKYFFHADVEFDHWADFKKSFDEIGTITYQSKIYGVYPKGKEFIS